MKFAGEHFTFPENLKLEPSVNSMLNLVYKVEAKCIKSIDDAILDEIIKAAREEGITDLIIMDRDFVISALKEKMERENGYEQQPFHY